MATVDELLATMAEEGIAHDDDICFADQDTRAVDIPKRLKIIGVENDDDVVIRRFRVPAICCETDLSSFDIRINFENAKKERDCYYVTDAVVDGDCITFSWLVDRKALRYKGKLRFAIHMELLDADGYIEKEWNTTPAHFDVLEGLEVELTEEEEEAARAAATQLVRLLEKEGENQAAAIAEAGERTIASIPEDYTALVGTVDKNAKDSTGNDLRTHADGTSRLPTGLFINGTVSISDATSANYGKVSRDVTYMVVTEEIQCFPVDVTLAVVNHPFSFCVFEYDENDNLAYKPSYKREEHTIKAGTRFRVAIYNSNKQSGVADITEYVNEVQVLPAQRTPNTVVSEGAINAMMQIAEGYFNWAYNNGGSSPLVYKGAPNENCLWYKGMAPETTEDGVQQYGINCSSFANALLQGVPLYGSRYMLGADAENQRAAWGYAYDQTARFADFHTTVFKGEPTEYNNLGSVFSYDMFRYAEQHGFAYVIADDYSNVRPGDMIFSANIGEYSNRYRGISHVALCLAASKYNDRFVVVEGTEATRSIPGGKSGLPVGIRIASVAKGNYRYGARFPLGDVDCRPHIAAQGIAPLAEVTHNTKDADGNSIKVDLKRAKLNVVPRGIYTAIVKGTFTNRPRFGFIYQANGVNDWASMLKVDEKTYVVTRYMTARAELYIGEADSQGERGTFELESAVVYHGYASPHTSAVVNGSSMEYVNLTSDADLAALDALHTSAQDATTYHAIARCYDLPSGQSIMPSRTLWYLDGCRYNASYGIQRISTHADASLLYQRSYSNDTWGAWTKI